MNMLQYLEENRFYIVKDTIIPDVSALYVGHIIGLGAVILNGYSYENLVGNVTYLCNCKELDGVSSAVFRLVYIKDYKEPDFGFQENHVSSPERTICDFLMYPEELQADLWIYDAIEGYIEDDETPDDFHLVYEMMEKLGIDKGLLDERLHDINEMY